MSTTTTSHRPPPKPLDIELTIISAKHLKNVNWRNGDLTPYAIFWLDPNHRLTTKPDHSNSTKPIWNELFHIPIPIPSSPSPPILTLEIFHSIPSDTSKPLVGTLRFPIHDLPNPQHNNINNNNNTVVRTFDLRRPSGRVQGKIRLKLALRDRVLPDYQIAHQPSYYYNTAITPSYRPYPPSPSPFITVPPPPTPPQPQPQPRPYHYGPYSDAYSGYYNGGYYHQPQLTQRGNAERPGHGDGGGIGGPSAPVEYGQYEQKQETGKAESGAGLGLAMPSTVRQSGYGIGGGVNGPSAPVDYAQYEQKHKTENVASGVGLGMEVGVTPPRPSPSGYGDGGGVGGPSAPVNYAQYELKQKTGLGLGGVAGLAVDEGPRYHDEERVESDVNARELDDYSGYRRVDY